MGRMIACALRLTAFVLICVELHVEAHEKSEYCELHPKIEERIIKDVGAWGSAGITEDLVLTISKHCQTPERITQHHCNCHPQRILIENGKR